MPRTYSICMRMASYRRIFGLVGRQTLVVLLMVAVLAPAGFASHVNMNNDPSALQRCADLWNAMTFRSPKYVDTDAVILAAPCAVRLPYRYNLVGTPATRCKSGDHMITKRPIECVSTTLGFACRVDAYHAYQCAQNASSIRAKATNANINARGLLTLAHPPHVRPSFVPPSWVRNYPHLDGFIQPWTADASRLRSGLRFLHESESGTCGQGSDASGAKGAIRCYGANRVLDPCFPQGSSVGSGVVAACPVAAGSEQFVRFQITGLS